MTTAAATRKTPTTLRLVRMVSNWRQVAEEPKQHGEEPRAEEDMARADPRVALRPAMMRAENTMSYNFLQILRILCNNKCRDTLNVFILKDDGCWIEENRI